MKLNYSSWYRVCYPANRRELEVMLSSLDRQRSELELLIAEIELRLAMDNFKA